MWPSVTKYPRLALNHWATASTSWVLELTLSCYAQLQALTTKCSLQPCVQGQYSWWVDTLSKSLILLQQALFSEAVFFSFCQHKLVLGSCCCELQWEGGEGTGWIWSSCSTCRQQAPLTWQRFLNCLCNLWHQVFLTSQSNWQESQQRKIDNISNNHSTN